MTIELHVTLPQGLSNAGALPERYRAAMVAAMRGVIHDLAEGVRQRTPIATGLLRASIGEEVAIGTEANTLAYGRVFVQGEAPYAIHVEEGTAPHTPPIAPLIRWATLVLGDPQAAYRVRAKIRRVGTAGQYMFRDTEATLGPTIEPRLAQASLQIELNLSGEL